jgi:hypothetical protein
MRVPIVAEKIGVRKYEEAPRTYTFVFSNVP